MHLDYKHVICVFYVRKNTAEDRYILLKPAAGDITTKIQDTFIYYLISVSIYVFLISHLKIFLFHDYSEMKY